jgi:hypothetical protein
MKNNSSWIWHAFFNITRSHITSTYCSSLPCSREGHMDRSGAVGGRDRWCNIREDIRMGWTARWLENWSGVSPDAVANLELNSSPCYFLNQPIRWASVPLLDHQNAHPWSITYVLRYNKSYRRCKKTGLHSRKINAKKGGILSLIQKKISTISLWKLL